MYKGTVAGLTTAALKTLPTGRQTVQHYLQSFHQELLLWATLRNQHITQFYGVCTIGMSCWCCCCYRRLLLPIGCYSTLLHHAQTQNALFISSLSLSSFFLQVQTLSCVLSLWRKVTCCRFVKQDQGEISQKNS